MVAIKVCHPGIDESIRRDLRLLGWITKTVQFLLPPLKWIDLPGQVKIFSKMMLEQLDLRQEAFNLHKFAQNFEATAKAWGRGPIVRFPRIIRAERHCLIEELVSETCLPVDEIGKRVR